MRIRMMSSVVPGHTPCGFSQQEKFRLWPWGATAKGRKGPRGACWSKKRSLSRVREPDHDLTATAGRRQGRRSNCGKDMAAMAR